MNGVELYNDLKFKHYWKSLSQVPDVAIRGYSMVQSNWHYENGINIDDDLIQPDRKEGLTPPLMLPEQVGRYVKQVITLYSDGTFETK
jgi:hypothetical protein